ncbi:MAG: phosphatase PAP2 family protein [Actinobacteria bacterium]|nr:phosphatase PAP2 family protein [Actinomycetota bacterium]
MSTPDDNRPAQRLLRGPRPGALPKQGSLRWSFTWAFEGIVFVLRTQRNMQIHVAAGLLVLILALVLGVSRFELLALVIVVALVLVAEMFNTALEAAIDAVVTSYHPLVKMAKDVAAGAVLVAALAAIAVAYLILYGRLSEPGRDLLQGVRQAPTHVAVIVIVAAVIAVVALKAYSGAGTALRGGFPSGHAAVAFAAWMAITLIVLPLTHGALVSTLAFLIALLAAQSRLEAGFHSAAEVVAGALLGAGITLLLFQIWG